MTAALDAALPSLACPVCGSAFESALPGARVLRCGSGHAFDVARQGFVSLLAGRRPSAGDTAAMVEARERFLSAGHYSPLTRAVVDAVHRALGQPPGAEGPPPPLVVDLAGGTGHHLAAVLDARPELAGVVLELSVAALRRAARGHPRAAAVGADVWRRLPIRDAAASIALSVFGPRNPAELLRVLAPGGALVVVTPTPRHLAELVTAVGMLSVDERKPERLRDQLAGFEPGPVDRVEAPLRLTRSDARDAVLMGPSGHHLSADAVTERLLALADPVEVTLSVEVSVHRRPASSR